MVTVELEEVLNADCIPVSREGQKTKEIYILLDLSSTANDRKVDRVMRRRQFTVSTTWNQLSI